MAKRKRQPGGGSKLRPVTDYRAEQYVPYIFTAETGILEAWTMDPDIRDGDVRETLRGLIKTIKRTGQLPPELTGSPEKSAETLLEWCILDKLARAFKEQDSLNVEDTIGVLTVINNSVGAWNRGMRGQEYLKYIKDFLGGVGVEIRRLTEEEVEQLGLILPDDSDDSIEGGYREI